MTLMIILALLAGSASLLLLMFVRLPERQPGSGFDPVMVALAAVLFISAALWLQSGSYIPALLYISLAALGAAAQYGKFRKTKLQSYRRR